MCPVDGDWVFDGHQSDWRSSFEIEKMHWPFGIESQCETIVSSATSNQLCGRTRIWPIRKEIEDSVRILSLAPDARVFLQWDQLFPFFPHAFYSQKYALVEEALAYWLDIWNTIWLRSWGWSNTFGQTCKLECLWIFFFKWQNCPFVCLICLQSLRKLW